MRFYCSYHKFQFVTILKLTCITNLHPRCGHVAWWSRGGSRTMKSQVEILPEARTLGDSSLWALIDRVTLRTSQSSCKLPQTPRLYKLCNTNETKKIITLKILISHMFHFDTNLLNFSAGYWFINYKEATKQQ